MVVQLLVVAVLAQSPPSAPSKWTAVVGDDAVTDDQVKKAAAADLERLELKKKQADLGFQRDEQTIYARTLEMLIEGKIVESEAKKRDITPEALLAAEVDSKVPDPTDAEVTEYWEANKASMSLPIDKALIQIRAYLVRQRRTVVYQKYMTNLRDEYDIKTSVDPVRTAVATQGFPSTGPVSAPVTIVEFSDFECPFCAALFPTLKEIKKHYGDKVEIVFRQFPLPNLHVHSQKAAEASLCAFEQNKFWELHDAMFLDNKNLDVASLKRKGAALMLNTEEFAECLDAGRYASVVAREVQEGVKVGVTGTPTLFIDGRYLKGVHSNAEISQIIEEELRKNRKPQ